MKVILIGASTSGLFAAYLLAKEGVEVEVYERSNTIGWPQRTLIVTSKLFGILGFIPEEAIINRVKYLDISSKTKAAKVALGCPDLVIERKKIIEILGCLADKNGAKIIFQHEFKGFYQCGREIVVTFQDSATRKERRIRTDILVAADGAASAVCLAASQNGHHHAALLQAKVHFPHAIRDDICKVWFLSNQTKYFYWLIPESKEIAVIGLIAEDAQQAKISLMEFLQERQLKALELQSALVPMYRLEYTGKSLNPIRNIFTVGDAAAQVKTTTVGGVVTGLHGAKALASAIVNGRLYHEELANLRVELNFHLIVRNILNRFNNDGYDELVTMLQGELKEVIEKWPRDELSRFFENNMEMTSTDYLRRKRLAKIDISLNPPLKYLRENEPN